jgi:hypothetical protein
MELKLAQSNKKELAVEISASQSGAFSAGSRICSSGVGLKVDWEGECIMHKSWVQQTLGWSTIIRIYIITLLDYSLKMWY